MLADGRRLRFDAIYGIEPDSVVSSVLIGPSGSRASRGGLKPGRAVAPEGPEGMDLSVIWSNAGALWDGAVVTVALTAISILIGLALAVPLALMRVSTRPLLWMPVYGYILYFRGTPLLVQIFLIYYGSGQFRELLETVGLWGFFREAYFCAILSLSLNTAGYTAELLRGAIRGVPHGEIEAARACGMSGMLLYRRIILPSSTPSAPSCCDVRTIVAYTRCSVASR